MAQYKGTLTDNSRGNPVSRLGHKTVGMDATLNGWEIGARIAIGWDEDKRCDVITILETGGSNGEREDEVLMELWENGEIEIFGKLKSKYVEKKDYHICPNTGAKVKTCRTCSRQ